MGMPTATVRLRVPGGEVVTCASVGSGPLDAAFKAIDQVVKTPSQLVEYSVHAITEGIDALGETSVRLRACEGDGRLNPQRGAEPAPVFHGHGADTDIVVASTKAYLAALNRLVAMSVPRAAE